MRILFALFFSTILVNICFAEESFPRYFSVGQVKYCMVLDDKGEIFACMIDQNCQEYPQCQEFLPKSF